MSITGTSQAQRGMITDLLDGSQKFNEKIETRSTVEIANNYGLYGH